MLPRPFAMVSCLFCCTLFLGPPPGFLAAFVANRDEPEMPMGTPREQFAAIKGKLDQARAEYIAKLQKATTTDERNQLSRAVPRTEGYARQMMRLAQLHPRDPVALDALIWVTANTPSGIDAAGRLSAQAKEEIVKTFGESDRIGPFVLGLAWPTSKANETMLRHLLERNQHDQVRAFTKYALTQQLISQAQAIELFQIRLEIAANEDAKKSIRQSLDQDYDSLTASMIRTRTAQSLNAEVERLLAEIASLPAESAAKWRPANSKLNVKEMAQRDLEVMRTLECGKSAPATEGKGIAGETIALKDYKGKVVLLNFTGHWCIACRRFYPLERELTKKYQEGPFAILNINSDPTVDLVKKLIQDEKMTWPVIWDGGTTEGPLATRWKVQGWPMVVLIDHEGIIRYKFRGAPVSAILYPLVDRLVTEARTKGKEQELRLQRPAAKK